jgi:phospholipid transport system substrate-binding protein
MNPTCKIRRSLWILAALGVASLPARAADDPRELLESSVNEVMSIVYDQPATDQPLSVRVRPILDRSFDYEYATRSAVGPGWKEFTPEQQARTVKLFSDLVIRTYADRFEPGSRPTMTFGKTQSPSAKRREIPTTVTYEGNNYYLSYRFRETPDGWRVYDIIIENVSMISNYRAQFDELFRKGGAESVLRSLEENLAQIAKPKRS